MIPNALVLLASYGIRFPVKCEMMKLLIHSQASIEVWEWISNFITHFIMDVITYVSKRGPWYLLTSHQWFIMDVITYVSKSGSWYLFWSSQYFIMDGITYDSRKAPDICSHPITAVWSYLSCAPAGSQWSIVNGAIPSLIIDWWPLYILNNCSHTATVADTGLAAWGRHTLDNHIPWQSKGYFPGQGSTSKVVHLSNVT